MCLWLWMVLPFVVPWRKDSIPWTLALSLTWSELCIGNWLGRVGMRVSSEKEWAPRARMLLQRMWTLSSSFFLGLHFQKLSNLVTRWPSWENLSIKSKPPWGEASRVQSNSVAWKVQVTCVPWICPTGGHGPFSRWHFQARIQPLSFPDKGCAVLSEGLFSETGGSCFQSKVKFKARISIFKCLRA